MVDFLCSKISIFDIRRIQPKVLPTPKSSEIEIGFRLHSNKNHAEILAFQSKEDEYHAAIQ